MIQHRRAVTIAASCQSGGVQSVDWQTAALTSPSALITMGKALIGTGADVDCSRAAFRAIADVLSSQRNLLFVTMLGLDAVGLLVGDTTTLATLGQQSKSALRTVANLRLLNDLAGYSSSADTIAIAMFADREKRSAGELWILGSWFAARSRGRELDEVIRAMDRKRDPTMAGPWAMFESVRARSLLLQGDTAGAVRGLANVDSNLSLQGVEWLIFEAHAADHLLLAQIALQRGQPQQAARIAQRLDRSLPLLNVIFLEAALRTRIRAMEAMGDGRGAAVISRRLRQLQGHRVR